jgi:HAD superfamily hydrolase (TIGR01509 family)
MTVHDRVDVVFRDVDLSAVTTLLCDADGNLFASEEPAYEASVTVVNRLMEELNCPRRFGAEQLRLSATGKNFRSTVEELAAECGAHLSEEQLEHWVMEEKLAVSDHLREVLRPDPEVLQVLTRLSRRYHLAAVSSSALSRLDACFEVTGLAELLPPERRFSAEDSLPAPTSKPDPAVYTTAGESLGISARQGLAIEDSATGARSAVAAGFPTVGNVRFVAPEEREQRICELKAAGVFAVGASWTAFEHLLLNAVLPTSRLPLES